MKKDRKKDFSKMFQKIDLLGEKGKETLDGIKDKSVDLAQNTSKATKEAVLDIATRVNDKLVDEALKKYNPVFMGEFEKLDFNLPNLIMIIDDATSKYQEDIKKGSIGYRSTLKDLEILRLYDESVFSTGLSFVPFVSVDSLYYVDPHDKKRFIQLDSFFEKMQESKLAELQHIAFSLGAKRYSIEMVETKAKYVEKGRKASSKAVIPNVNIVGSAERTYSNENKSVKKIVASAEFSDNNIPILPELKWFIQDDIINNLINMKCKSNKSSGMKSYDILINGSQYSSMNLSTAHKINMFIKKVIPINTNLDIKEKSLSEHKHSLRFHLEWE